MTAAASLTIQKAIIDKLLATSAVTNLIGVRIYDRVPTNPTRPYVSIGPSQDISDDAECIEGFEVFQQVDVWSIEPGFPEAKQIAGEIRKAIHGVDLTLTGYALVEIEHRGTRHLRDPDGLTSHAVIDFRAMVETDE